MRLIDADALIEDIREHSESYFADDFAHEWVDRQPTIEPKRKAGQWIHDGYDFPHGNDWIHCSKCGKRGINVPADLTNFCPNCGADMRGEQDEQID